MIWIDIECGKTISAFCNCRSISNFYIRSKYVSRECVVVVKKCERVNVNDWNWVSIATFTVHVLWFWCRKQNTMSEDRREVENSGTIKIGLIEPK